MSCDFLPLMHTAIVTSGSVSVSLSLLSGMFTLSSLMTTEARLSLSLSLSPLTHTCMHARARENLANLPDVFLTFRKTPKSNSQLDWLWYWLGEMFHHFKWYIACHSLGRQLRQWTDLPL